jgi:hypothetical protein
MSLYEEIDNLNIRLKEMKNAYKDMIIDTIRSFNMTDTDTIKDLQQQVRELEVACNGYKAQRDAALDMLFDRGLTLDDYNQKDRNNAQEINI